ncbi:MAG: hypothetical protein AW10_01035 [Candidatus Accumulibacter appositus]|uniref:Uncharacterized protein n=1 Tax=Candidatus Accumulibacter appositus TaxID=1454003 RepID=A0A011PXH0_9PROT|nr:MAG: hypothetical protein AW10_01035 [Candidatus Accumulibacter appositus]
MIALAIVLQSVLGTFVYFEQARLVKAAALAPEVRTQLFALIDLAVNLLALGLQALVAGRLMQKLGLGITLAAVPLLLAVPLAVLAAIPVLAVVLSIQVVSRAGTHGLMRPAREALFTAVGTRGLVHGRRAGIPLQGQERPRHGSDPRWRCPWWLAARRRRAGHAGCGAGGDSRRPGARLAGNQARQALPAEGGRDIVG